MDLEALLKQAAVTRDFKTQNLELDLARLDQLKKILAQYERTLLEQKRKKEAAAQRGIHSSLHVMEASAEDYPSFRDGETPLYWEARKSSKRQPAGVHRGRASLYPPEQLPYKQGGDGGWTGGPKWCFSREKRRQDSEHWDANPLEPLMTKDKKWFPMYVDMQEEVELAWRNWQSGDTRTMSDTSELEDALPELPHRNRNLLSKTPKRDNRWTYILDFDRMEQTNLLTKTVRRIRRFGMGFDGHPEPEWKPEEVGMLSAADGRKMPQT